MRMSARMKRLLAGQVAMEYEASSAYLSIASWCEATGYRGGAAYFYAQSSEERDHMLRIISYLNETGAGARVPAVGAPPGSYRSLEAAVKAALKNEQAVTKSIHRMVDLARSEKDHRTYAFLEWFVREQAQEEAKFEDLLLRFDLIGRDKLAINEIDKILAADAAAGQQDAAGKQP